MSDHQISLAFLTKYYTMGKGMPKHVCNVKVIVSKKRALREF